MCAWQEKKTTPGMLHETHVLQTLWQEDSVVNADLSCKEGCAKQLMQNCGAGTSLLRLGAMI